MNRKITCILACVLVIVTVIPSMALAASNAAILDKLKLSDVKKYDVALPTKGINKTEKQINDLLKNIPNKPSGKGNTVYRYYLDLCRPCCWKPGSYEAAIVSKEWFKYVDKTKRSFLYQEHKDLQETEARITCYINQADTKNVKSYRWIKGEKTGSHYIYKPDKDSKTVKPTNYKLYPDVTLLGEKCMVYSYESKYSDWMITHYRFVSRSTGQYIKYIDSEQGSDPEYIFILINFEYKLIDKADSFFNPPKNIEFETYKY